jgi:hypothetical protein
MTLEDDFLKFGDDLVDDTMLSTLAACFIDQSVPVTYKSQQGDNMDCFAKDT